MAKHDIYWYQESAFIRNAFLYHCRNDDMRRNSAAKIISGTIVAGQGGYAIAEQAVPGFEATIVDFTPNRQCEWEGFTLECMVHPKAPLGKSTKAALRPFNNVVAEIRCDAAVAVAAQKLIPVVNAANGAFLINLEISSFQNQGVKSPRRAKLLPSP